MATEQRDIRSGRVIPRTSEKTPLVAKNRIILDESVYEMNKTKTVMIPIYKSKAFWFGAAALLLAAVAFVVTVIGM